MCLDNSNKNDTRTNVTSNSINVDSVLQTSNQNINNELIDQKILNSNDINKKYLLEHSCELKYQQQRNFKNMILLDLPD